MPVLVSASGAAFGLGNRSGLVLLGQATKAVAESYTPKRYALVRVKYALNDVAHVRPPSFE